MVAREVVIQLVAACEAELASGALVHEGTLRFPAAGGRGRMLDGT